MYYSLNNIWIPARTSGIHSLLTEPICVTWRASIDRHAVGLSDIKVSTGIIDIVIILYEIARADVPFASQTTACLVRGGGVERAFGGVLSRAHWITS